MNLKLLRRWRAEATSIGFAARLFAARKAHTVPERVYTPNRHRTLATKELSTGNAN
jgi:hypothetical protein